MHITTKRVYDEPSPEDGTRVLVDRLWPRGIGKGDARVGVWAKELAPSTALRKWFHSGDGEFSEFARRYRAELRGNADAVEGFFDGIDLRRRVTLVYAAKDTARNHALVLKEYLEGLR